MAIKVIPIRPDMDEEILIMGPSEVLRFAILGGIAHGPADIEDLIASTQCLGGTFWHPTGDVIVDCLIASEAQGLVTIENQSTAASTAVIRLTSKGFDQVSRLMLRDTTDISEQLFYCLVGIKISLLDYVPPAERRRQIDEIVRRLKLFADRVHGTVSEQTDRNRHLCKVADFEARRIKSEIQWLLELRDPGLAATTGN